MIDRPHMLIVLWNYGLKYNDEHIKYYKNNPLKNLFKKYSGGNFIPKKRYYLLNDRCPISLNLICKLAILTDGTVYEYELIKSHLMTKNTNPLTNEILSCEPSSLHYKDNGVWKGAPVSTKILYIPENDIFEHFELV